MAARPFSRAYNSLGGARSVSRLVSGRIVRLILTRPSGGHTSARFCDLDESREVLTAGHIYDDLVGMTSEPESSFVKSSGET